MSAKLTPKQEAFALAYITTGNASEAYRQAYDAEDMKPMSVTVNASKLLKSAKVALRVAELREPALAAAGSTAERTLREVADVGYANPKAQGETIKFGEKLAALEMLMKHHGLYKKDNSQKAPNVAIQVVLE